MVLYIEKLLFRKLENSNFITQSSLCQLFDIYNIVITKFNSILYLVIIIYFIITYKYIDDITIDINFK